MTFVRSNVVGESEVSIEELLGKIRLGGKRENLKLKIVPTLHQNLEGSVEKVVAPVDVSLTIKTDYSQFVEFP
jgi:hypothetical protein